MGLVRRNGHWVIALVGVVSLAFAAGVMAEKQGTTSSVVLAPPPPAVADRDDPAAVKQGLNDARGLSAVFRRTAREALPAIVSIETKGKVVKVAQHDEEFFQNSPFGEFFKNDPRFRDMFKNQPRQSPRSHGMGSGFIIDPSGIVLTNAHVVSDAESVKVKLSDGREYSATAGDIKADPRSDVAIIRLKVKEHLPSIRLGNSDVVEVGDWVLAVGSPFGLDLTVTAGIISAKGRGPGIAEREDFIQTDAAINPGNSGGPLLNLDGEVIGINTAISTRSGGYDGVGFAVPINMARWVAQQLIDKGTVSRAYLGVAIQAVDNELARQLKVSVGHGALVNQVMPDSPAADAQLESGDLVIKLDGKDVHSPRGLQGIVEQLSIGQSYPVVVLREGKEVTLQIKMKEMPKNFSKQGDVEESKDAGETNSTKHGSFEELGIELSDLTAAMAKQLGYKTAQGVLVSSVKDDSPAATAGLQEGMLIEKVGQRPVNSVAEFTDAVKGLSVKEGVMMLVRSKAGTRYLAVRSE